jgi:ribulose-phosphate 3-epimerase
MAIKIAPSILSADFANLQRDVEMLNQSQAEWIHVDVMDGVFVPNISLGIPVIQAIKKHSTKWLDVHLMITQPDRYLHEFKKAGADVLTVHVEACDHLHRTLHAIRELGMKAGVALNPHTPVQAISEVLDCVDLVCVMSVNPGFGGQQFIPQSLRKIAALHEIKSSNNLGFEIEVDGGVSEENARLIALSGATVLVAGNAVFKSISPSDQINKLKLLTT